MILPASSPVPIGTEIKSLRRDYGKKNLEIANVKAQGDSDYPFEAFWDIISIYAY
jgi:hypothetical protein